jgi:hypothetical protein
MAKKETLMSFCGAPFARCLGSSWCQNGKEKRMFGLKFGRGSFIAAVACLAILVDGPGTALAQQGAAPKKTRAKRLRAKKSVAISSPRPKGETEAKTVADRILLRDGKELLGQVDESSSDGMLTILARRETVRKTLPNWAPKWEEAEKVANTLALRQRRERLAGWRRERPAESASGDRITAWLDHELAQAAGPVAPSTLMAIRLDRDDVSAVERRSDSAAQALRAAWVLGLASPETTPPATLKDSIVGRGMILANDDPIVIDRLLPPYAERADHWLLRRAATEVIYDEGLRFIGFGNTILPEPVPGQPINPATGLTLVEGTIRDVLGVGRADSLHSRLGAVAARSRAGMILTKIVIAPDLTTASAESTLYFYNGSNWDRAVWRSQRLEVGTVPPIVVSMVAADPQVQAVMNLIDSVGAGFVSPEMKERGLVVGTTVGGAVVLARTALIRALTGLAFDVEGKASVVVPRATPR